MMMGALRELAPVVAAYVISDRAFRIPTILQCDRICFVDSEQDPMAAWGGYADGEPRPLKWIYFSRVLSNSANPDVYPAEF